MPKTYFKTKQGSFRYKTANFVTTFVIAKSSHQKRSIRRSVFRNFAKMPQLNFVRNKLLSSGTPRSEQN